MSSKPNDFKIGIFVLIGVAVLLAALFIFGASKWFQGKTLQETYVAGDVGGLKVGAPVTLHGVPVGQVTRVNFTWNVYHQKEPRFVYVEFEVDNKVSLAPKGEEYARFVQEQVNKGLRARIKSQGLASSASIVSLEYLDPKEYPIPKVPWTPRHIFIPSAPGQFSEIVKDLTKTMAAIKQIDFAKIGSLVQTDLNTGGRLLTHADEMNLQQLGTNANGLVADARGIAAQLHTYIGITNQSSATDLQQISRHADELVARLQTTVTNLDRTIGNLDISSLNETLENFRRASSELDETLK